MKYLAKWILVGVIVSNAAVAADAAPVDPAAGADSPVVYLYKDPSGNVYTLDVVENDQGVVTGAHERSVSTEEIAALEDAGVQVSFVETSAAGMSEPLASPGSKTTRNGDFVALAHLPPIFSIVLYHDAVYGNFFVTGTQPAGKTKQWVAYGFISDHMADYGSHMAIGLLADTQQLTQSFPPTYAPAAVANGIIVGNVAGTPNGCGFAENTTPVYNMEIESFWNGGNRLYPQTCSPQGLADRTPYVVEINADTAGNVAYGVAGGMSWLPPTVNTLPDRPSGSAGTLAGGGLFFGLVPVPGGPDLVTLNFIGAQTGWF